MLPLTKRQREILDYLNEFIQQHGYAPSLEEIGRRFSLSSLATVHKGGGNNGRDKTEGAVRGRVVGTYLHGPVLPANPAFADALLEQALLGRTGGAPLAALDDSLELAAHRGARGTRR